MAQNNEEIGDIMDHLTPREAEIAMQKATGSTNNEIARDLGISPNTVKWHWRNAKERTGLSTAPLLIRVAISSSSTPSPLESDR